MSKGEGTCRDAMTALSSDAQWIKECNNNYYILWVN